MDAPVHAAFTLAADRVLLVQQWAIQLHYAMRIHARSSYRREPE